MVVMGMREVMEIGEIGIRYMLMREIV